MIVPAEGSSRPASRLSTVVLPQPECPMMQVNSPRDMESHRSSNTVVIPPPGAGKRLVIPSNEMNLSLIAPAQAAALGLQLVSLISIHVMRGLDPIGASLSCLASLVMRRLAPIGANLRQDRQSLGGHATLQAGHPVIPARAGQAKPGPNPTFCTYWIVRLRGR